MLKQVGDSSILTVFHSTKILKEELDAQPICFKGRIGQKAKLKAVPDWQERLREYVDKLIEEVDKQ
ncbi:MAG: hypothetical protein ICV78_18975 [Tolypothrix sp. Co-bin9]|nr:hypothetical protein [Tolypothrix sp. Co-bin9]